MNLLDIKFAFLKGKEIWFNLLIKLPKVLLPNIEVEVSKFKQSK